MEAMKGLFFPRVFSMVIFPFFYGLRLKDTLVSHPRPCGWGTLENLGCRDFPRGWLFLFRVGTFSCCCPCQWGYWVPLFTIWDSVAGPGRTPMPGNNSGRIIPGLAPGRPTRAVAWAAMVSGSGITGGGSE